MSIWGIGPITSRSLPTFVWKKRVAAVEMTVMMPISSALALSTLTYVRMSIGQMMDMMKLKLVLRTMRFLKYLFSERSEMKMKDFRLNLKMVFGEANMRFFCSIISNNMSEPIMPLAPAMKNGSANRSNVLPASGMTAPAKIVPTRLAKDETAKNRPMTEPLFLTVVTSPPNAAQVGLIIEPMNIWIATRIISCHA